MIILLFVFASKLCLIVMYILTVTPLRLIFEDIGANEVIIIIIITSTK